jgi:hypothetical protein
MHVLEHPDLPDLLNHSDTLMAGLTEEIRESLASDTSKVIAKENILSQYEELRSLKRSTPTTRRFIGLAISSLAEQSAGSVAIEMKNVLAAKHPAALNNLFEADARGG